MAKYEVYATHFDEAARKQCEYSAGEFESYNNARIFADAYSAHYSSPAKVREISPAAQLDRLPEIRAAADLAARISAGNETAHGLALALETLTAAGDETPAGRYNAAARRAQAGAVLQALADQLDRMQAAADQLEEITTQLAQPGRLSPADDQSGAALCAQDPDQISDAALPDQPGSGYTLDSGEPLADFARRVQRLDADQLDQLEAAEQKRSSRTRKGGATQ